MIENPSQFQIDNSDSDDILFINKRSKLYKWWRKYFRKNLKKVKVNDKEEYQEDCTIVYSYELKCIQRLEDCVPACFSKTCSSDIKKIAYLQVVQVSLNNIQIQIDSSHTITFPVSFVQQAIERNNRLLKEITDEKKKQKLEKFKRKETPKNE